MSETILTREDVKAQLAVVADIGGQFTGEDSLKATQLIEAHDANQRELITQLTADRDRWKDAQQMSEERHANLKRLLEESEVQVQDSLVKLERAHRALTTIFLQDKCPMPGCGCAQCVARCALDDIGWEKPKCPTCNDEKMVEGPAYGSGQSDTFPCPDCAGGGK